MDSLLNTAPCGYVAFADDGTIVDVNQTLAEMVGSTRIELLGWHVEKILPPGGRIFYHTHFFPLLKMHGRVEELYFALRTRDGRDVPVLLNGVRREREGRFISDCIAVRMIQRHAFEDQLLEARRLAEEASAAKAKFLSMMSHDLRAPLTTIYGHAGLLEGGVGGSLTEEQRGSVQAIRDACRVLTTMIGDILEYAQLDSGRVRVQPRPVRVAEAVARAEALIRLQVAEGGLTFTAGGCDPELIVLADPDKLQQILLNLLTNAIKFTPAGGSIAVVCGRAEDRGHIAVRDSGIGIEAADLQRIFSPFVQVDVVPAGRNAAGAPRGVGLGLAISRDLARAMKGDVTAESEPGAGSTFVIELPVAEAAVPA